MTSRFEQTQPQPGYGQNHIMSEAEKADQTHMEYAGNDHDNAVHTPKDVEQPMLDYEHRGTPFEKKVLRKIDWRLVPVLCESTYRLGVSAVLRRLIRGSFHVRLLSD